MSLLDDIFGPGFASSILGNPLQASAFADAERQNQASAQIWAQHYQHVLSFKPIWPPPREPGIYWTRTGGKTHRVEIVR